MIAELLAAMAVQAVQNPTVTSSRTPATDLPAAVAKAVSTCATIQLFLEANPEQPIATPLRSLTAADGSVVQYRIERGLCQITAADWAPDGEVMARTVENGLAQLPAPAVRTRWRESFVNERGPSVWTTFERQGPDGMGGVFNLFEPADGATGEVSITYQTVRR